MSIVRCEPGGNGASFVLLRCGDVANDANLEVRAAPFYLEGVPTRARLSKCLPRRPSRQASRQQRGATLQALLSSRRGRMP
eukprot:5969867-Pyramimonas_sp.AAC.1